MTCKADCTEVGFELTSGCSAVSELRCREGTREVRGEAMANLNTQWGFYVVGPCNNQKAWFLHISIHILENSSRRHQRDGNPGE